MTANSTLYFTAVVSAVVDTETRERGVIATQQFANILDAEKFALVEAHGPEEAVWEITAQLPVAKACSTVMASRNREIGIFLTTGASSAIPAYNYLKAPLTCAVLRSVYAQSPAALVAVRMNATHLFVD